MTSSQSVPKQRLWNPKLTDFMSFVEIPKKTILLEKFKLLDKR